MNAPEKDTATTQPAATPRAIEVGFPIVEINRLAAPERNSFKPIYQMHKWFARRASCVFRAILLGALKPAVQPDGTLTDLMAEFYRNHSDDPDTKGKVVLDPFMGGGTTVVESLRLGCKPIGIDLNPVAWFVVKTETEPVEIEALQAAFERLAARPVAWNEGRPLRDTLLDLYKTEAAPGVEADVIYTFWVKHAICTDPTCKKEVPLFKDYVVAQKTVSVRYWRDVACSDCGNVFDWETQVASLVAEKKLMINAPRGAAGEGRATAVWTYAPIPAKPKKKREETKASINCPCCANRVSMNVPWAQKTEKKKVSLTVLLCPSCETVWQWRGPKSEGEIACPSCGHSHDPYRGNVPEEKKGMFQCVCGNKDKVIESLRLLPQDRGLPVRPYAQQAYLPPGEEEREIETKGDGAQTSLFGDGAERQNLLPLARKNSAKSSLPDGYLLPANGKFFKRFSVSDRANLQEAERSWDINKFSLPYPKSAIPLGEKTKSGLLSHHYNYWHEMFAPRQLLALSTLLQGIIAEPDEKLRELLLCAFSGSLELNNLFTRYMVARKSLGGQTAQGVFARHDYQPKVTIAENNVFGLPDIAMGSFVAKFGLLLDGIAYRNACWDFSVGRDEVREKVEVDSIRDADLDLRCANSAEITTPTPQIVITDPPYVGNVNYAELADFFHVWLRLALKSKYPWFAPEYTDKGGEIVENRSRGKSRADFYSGLSQVFKKAHESLPTEGLLAFTFHHADQEGTVWEGLLQALCDTGFEIAAIYPVHSESETSSHHQDKENISYDLIHVCRKRQADPASRSWAGVRQEVRRRARAELAAIEAGRYGGKPLAEPDVRLICIGKCLELYSAHYDKVLDHEGKTLPLHRALQDISAIVDQLVTRDRPLPAELENIDSLSYVWLRCLMPRRAELSVDSLSKDLRALQVSVDDVKDAGLAVRGRDGTASGRSRSYKIKQPAERLEQALANLERVASRQTQSKLFDPNGQPEGLVFADLWQALIALADAGESVLPLLEKFRTQWPEIAAGLKFCRQARNDWESAIDRVIGVMEGAPLLVKHGVA
jgi:putative DNA methylase